MHTVKVTLPDGSTSVQQVDAPNQRDAHVVAARLAAAAASNGREIVPPVGTVTEIVRADGSVLSRSEA